MYASGGNTTNLTLEVSNNSTTEDIIIDLTASKIACNETAKSCNLSEGLQCRDNLCKCAYDNLIYNEEQQKCFAKVGEPCGFFIGLVNSSTVACPENAVCVLTNFEVVRDGQNNQYSVHRCACSYTNYQNDQGECVPMAKHGEGCDDKRKCNPDSELICVKNVCECPFKQDQFFDSQLQKCVSYAGGNCTRYCVPNSVCDFYGSGTCQCRLDYRVNGERMCEPIPPGYLSPCLGEKELCNTDAGLSCIDKICNCKNPLHQVYDFQLDKCIGLAGDYCDPDEVSLGKCVKDAACVKKKSSPDQHVCQCNTGFSTTPFRKCMKSHQEICSNEFCNVFRGLACINGSCQCYDSFLKYDISAEACVSSVGSPCGKIFAPVFSGDWMKISCPECDSYYFTCEKNSRCTRDFSQGEIGTLEKFRCQIHPDESSVKSKST